MRRQIFCSLMLAAILAGAFAFGANFLSGRQLIGVSTESGIFIGSLFGMAGAFVLSIISLLAKKNSDMFFLAGGVIYGIVMYLSNVVLGYNAGFSLFGLGLISAFGLMAGIGCLVVEHVFGAFKNLRHLT